MNPAAKYWRVRPAAAGGEGRLLSFDVLRKAIEDDHVGELDEVLAPGESRWQTVAEHRVTGDLLPRPPARRLNSDEEAETDMTPMIDVTFQLVIFFMITATFTVQKTLDLPSSKPDATGAVQTLEQLQQEKIVVVLTADGALTVDGEAVAMDELIDAIRTANRAKGSAEMILDVEDAVLHEQVVQVLDAAGAADIESVLFATRGRNAN